MTAVGGSRELEIEDIEPEPEKEGDQGFAVATQALPEGPAPGLCRAVGGQTWDERPGPLAPLLPLLFEPAVKLLIFTSDGGWIECQQDSKKKGEAPPQTRGEGKSKSKGDIPHVQGMANISVRPRRGKGFVLYDVARGPEACGNPEERKNGSDTKQDPTRFSEEADQDHKGDPEELPETFPAVPKIME